jgi:hypothetical protein
MSHPRVDPPLFRRRTFEEEWQAPLIPAARMGDPLSTIFLAEADAWLSFGAELGYFSAADSPSTPRECQSLRARAVIASIGQLRLPFGLGAPKFAQALSDAREDLTENRRELLQRILFSSPAEWEQAIGIVADLASAIELGREDALAGLDICGWALEGPVEASADEGELQATLPAGWRSGLLEGLSATVPDIGRRVRDLARVREQVREALVSERADAASAEFALDASLALVHRVPAGLAVSREHASPASALLTRGETAPEQLAQFGTASAGVYAERHQWVHSSVEEISFPDEDAPLVRRRTRLDFTIPMGLVPLEFPGPTTAPWFYVPVAEIPKWPDMLGLELRTGSGEALPLLTARQSAIIDGALLAALAEVSLGTSVSPRLDAYVRDLAHAGRDGPRGAEEALHKLYEYEHADRRTGARLIDDHLFAATATELASHSIVWARVSGWPGEQRVLEITYEISTDLKLRWTSPQVFGLRPLEAFIDVGPFGAAEHRVEIDAPANTRLVRVSPPHAIEPAAHSEDPHAPRRAEVAPQTVARLSRKRASVRFASTSPAATASSGVRIALTADQTQATGLALAGSVLCASTLLAAYIDAVRLSVNTTQSAGLAALLLIGAALAGFGAVTSLQRGALASALLAGTRRIALFVSALGLTGALSFLLRAGSSRAVSSTGGRIESFVLGDISLAASLLFAATLALSWRRSRTMRPSRYLPDERTDPPMGPVWDVASGELRWPIPSSR